MKRHIYILLAVISFSGCIREDRTNCPREQFIAFDITNPKYKFENVVKGLDLLIYDNNGVLLNSYSYTATQLARWDNKAPVPVQKINECTVVALVNYSEHAVNNKESLQQMQTSIVADEQDNLNYLLQDNFHGIDRVNLAASAHEVQRMTLSKNNNLIDVNLNFSSPVESAQYGAVITATNGDYDSRNIASGNRLITYNNLARSKTVNTLNYSFSIMRMWVGDDIKLSIIKYNQPNGQGQVVHNILITKHISGIIVDGVKPYDTNEKLELEDHFTLDIILDPKQNVILDITINGWAAVINEIDF